MRFKKNEIRLIVTKNDLIFTKFQIFKLLNEDELDYHSAISEATKITNLKV